MKTSELLTFLSRELNCSALSEFLDFKDRWRELMKLLRQAEWLISWTPSEQAKPVIADLVSLFRENSLKRQAASYNTVGLYCGSVLHCRKSNISLNCVDLTVFPLAY